jgi:hypothetical protein
MTTPAGLGRRGRRKALLLREAARKSVRCYASTGSSSASSRFLG